MKLTDEQLREIAERAEKARRGPWLIEYFHYNNDNSAAIYDNAGFSVTSEVSQDDATFIASSRTDIPALLAHIKALEEEKANLRHEIIESLRKEVWGKTLKVTTSSQYAKRNGKSHLHGQYEALKSVWELLGGDKPD